MVSRALGVQALLVVMLAGPLWLTHVWGRYCTGPMHKSQALLPSYACWYALWPTDSCSPHSAASGSQVGHAAGSGQWPSLEQSTEELALPPPPPPQLPLPCCSDQWNCSVHLSAYREGSPGRVPDKQSK